MRKKKNQMWSAWITPLPPKKESKQDSWNWIGVINYTSNARVISIQIFQFVTGAVQRLFDGFDAVLIDLLIHFNLIVIFVGIVATCSV